MGMDMDKKCVHHWQIPIANGPTSLGICEKCGSEKPFNNSIGTPERHINLAKDTSEPGRSHSSWMEGF